MYKHLDKQTKKQHAYILIILQKVCQNVNLLIMRKKTILGGAEFCANSHVFCAISHTQHNEIMLIFAKTSKK